MEEWTEADVLRLVPECREFEGYPWKSPSDWIHLAGTPGQAIAYADLFWPSFVEHNGCVFRREQVDDQLRRWYALHEPKLGRRDMERLANHLHLHDVFGDQAQPTADQATHLGTVIRAIWAAKLAVDFPARRFEVVMLNEPEPDGWVDCQITFCTIDLLA